MPGVCDGPIQPNNLNLYIAIFGSSRVRTLLVFQTMAYFLLAPPNGIHRGNILDSLLLLIPPSLLFSLRDLCRLSRPPRQPTLGTREALPSRFSVPMGHENRPLKRVSIMAGGTHPCSTSFTPIGAFRSEHLSERTPHDRRVTAAYPLLSVQRVYSAKT